jgi:hypothetical protein
MNTENKLLKKILVFLFLIPCLCKAQITMKADSAYSFGSIGFINSGIQDVYKKDTVKCLLLVFDSANVVTRTISGYEVRDIRIEGKGYHQSGDLMWFNSTEKYYYSLFEYLDERQNKLSKNIIVWLAKL